MVAALDQTGDTTRADFWRYAKMYNLPDYVKSADPSDVFDTGEEMPSTSFADPRKRLFNCSSKSATWVSYLYFLEKNAEIHPKIAEWIQERLDRFTDAWGIRPDIDALQEKNAALNKEALRDSDYMYVWADEDGAKFREYPIRNGLEVKTATAWFNEHRDHFTYSDRRTMATKLLEKANEFGTGLGDDESEMLEKQAGRGTYDPKVASVHIRQRGALAPNQDLRDGMAKMAETIQKNPQLAMDPGAIESMCHSLDTFDRLVKLAGNYTDRVPRPEDIFCGAAYKTARAAVDKACTLITGTVYNRQEFSKLALSDVRDAFGSNVAEAIAHGIMVDPEKFAELAETLPRPDAQMLDRIMYSIGAEPLLKHATTVERPQLSELNQLAAMA